MDCADGVSEIDDLSLQDDLAGDQPREIEQVVDDAREVPGLALDELRVIAVELPVLVLHLRGQQNRAERIPELVAEDGQEAVALVNAVFERLHQIADLVLPLACAQRRLRGADEALDAHGPVDQRDVRSAPEVSERAARALERRLAGQNDDRDVGPRRLTVECLGQARCDVGKKRLFGQHQRSGAFLQCGADGVDRVECLARETGRLEVRAHELRVAPDRRDDQHTMIQVFPAHASRISLTMFSNVGVPVSTPR